MRSYLSLVPISAKVHKRQSRMTRICIILAVFLVTSIFSMADMWTDAETTAMRHNHGTGILLYKMFRRMKQNRLERTLELQFLLGTMR